MLSNFVVENIKMELLEESTFVYDVTTLALLPSFTELRPTLPLPSNSFNFSFFDERTLVKQFRARANPTLVVLPPPFLPALPNSTVALRLSLFFNVDGVRCDSWGVGSSEEELLPLLSWNGRGGLGVYFSCTTSQVGVRVYPIREV